MKSKFSSRARAWADTTHDINPGEDPTMSRVRLRLDHELAKDIESCDARDREAVRALFQDKAEVRTQNLRLELTMSSAIGLMDLIEDEILPEEHLPLHLEVEDVFITLLEDRPPSNITSPGPVPLRFNLNKLNVDRGTDGDFHVSPRTEPFNPVPTLDDEELKRLRHECTSLRARLGVLERAAEEVRKLRRSRDEAEVLRSSLASAQDDIARLLEDKGKLLDELRRMRDLVHGVQQATQHGAQQTAPNKR